MKNCLQPMIQKVFRMVWKPQFVVLCLPLVAAGQIETGRWKTKAPGLAPQLPVFFPTPTVATGNPELLVIPLLGPQRRLLPGGKMLVWVGHNDGTSLAFVRVTLRVPLPGNPLVSGGSRVTEVTVETNADGIAEVFFTVPDVPPDDGGDPGGGGPIPF